MTLLQRLPLFPVLNAIELTQAHLFAFAAQTLAGGHLRFVKSTKEAGKPHTEDRVPGNTAAAGPRARRQNEIALVWRWGATFEFNLSGAASRPQFALVSAFWVVAN